MAYDTTSSPAVVRWGTRIAGAGAALIGAFWLAAWLTGFAARWAAAGAITVKTNMTLGLLLAGTASVLLANGGYVTTWRRRLAVAAGAVVLLLGAATLSEHVVGWDLGIDQLLVTEPPGAAATTSPNRMGLPGSTSLALLGAGLLVLARRRRNQATVPYLGLTVCLIVLIPLVGFLYGISEFYGTARLTGIAWPTTIALLLLGIGLMLAQPEVGPARLLLREDAGGMLLRRMLPVALLVPLAMGFLRVAGQRHGLYDTAMGSGLLVISLILVFSAMLWRSAAGLSRSAARQRQAEEALRDSDRRYSALFANKINGMAHCRVITDENGRPVDYWILQINEAYERILGIKKADIEGRRATEVFPDIKNYAYDYIGVYGKIALEGGEIKFEEFFEATGQYLSIYAYSPLPGEFAAIFADVTERKRAEEALRETRDYLEKLFGYANAPIICWDPRRTITRFNPAFEHLTGYAADEVIGRDLSMLFPDETRDDSLAKIERALTERWEVVEIAIQRKDGETRVALWNSANIYAEDGATILATIAQGQDITERKRAEELLQESESRYHSLFEKMLDGFAYCQMLFDEQGRPKDVVYLDVNEAFGRLTGLKNVVGKKITEVIPGIRESDPELFEIYGRVARTGNPERFEMEVKALRSMWLSISVYGPRPGHFVAVFDDITDRRRATETRLRLAAIVESSEDAIISKDLSGTILTWNEGAQRMFGYRAEEIVGQSIRMLLPPAQLQEEEQILLRLQRGEQVEHYETQRLAKSGRHIDVSVTISPLKDHEGRIIGVSKIARDITERKRAEKQLKELNETLEKRVAERTAVAEVRAEQLRMLAHELTQAEQRERQRISYLLHEHFQQLLVGAQYSLSIMHVYQDAPSQEAKRRTDQILAEAVEASRSLAVELSPPTLRYGGLAPALGWLGQWMHEKHGMNVEVIAEPPVPMPSEDTQILLFHAVRELLFNVVKHAKVNQAKVELKEEPGRLLRLSVSDKGAGLPAEGLIAKACTPGGFGLFSIRERLSFLEGRVEIQSAPGTGTCISLLVPLPPAAQVGPVWAATAGSPAIASAGKQDGEAGPPTVSAARIKVLVADDHAVVRDGLSRLLQTEPDMEIIGQAKDGREAVELTLQLRPDVVIMDVSMPEMSGIEATRSILADLPATRIIGLSMHKDQNVVDQMRQAGAVDYLAKSGPTDGLVAVIREHAAKATPGRQE